MRTLPFFFLFAFGFEVTFAQAFTSGSWTIQTTGVAAPLNAVSAVSGNTCWLAGDMGKIIRTVDGGNTWTLVNSGIIGTQSISAFEGVSEDTAFAGTTATDSTHIYRTSDGGTSWSKVFSQYGGSIFGIKMYSSGKGIALGNPVGSLWTVLKTTDEGQSWLRIPSEPPQIGGGNRGTRFGTFDTTQVYFYDNSVHGFSSADGGDTWTYTPDSTSYVPLFCWDRDYHSLDPAGLAVTPWHVFRYQFGWILAGHTPNFPIQPTALVGALETNDYWLVQGEVFYTSDAATTWTPAPPHGLNTPVGLIDMVTLGPEVTAWATGTGDTVYYYHRILTDVREHPQATPREFSLAQNYPNPFNPGTTIRFDLPRSSRVVLKVYNLLGQEMSTLVNEQLPAGTHTVQWDGTGRANGAYLYELSVDGSVNTRKMLLVK